jgi:cell division septum initiation protein DivIVA
VRNNFEEAKQFMLPEKSQQVQELLDESQYFKQQLFNEVRRTIMLDYFASRDSFLDVGEQYTNHLASNIKEWHKFVNFYSDVNNARKQKDEDYNREQFIGEELDWKMLADNLSLF